MLTYWYIVLSLSNRDLLAGWHWAWTIPSKLVSVMVQRCTSLYDLMPGRFVRWGSSSVAVEPPFVSISLVEIH